MRTPVSNAKAMSKYRPSGLQKSCSYLDVILDRVLWPAIPRSSDACLELDW
jgi:hypothetical protein